MAERDEGIDGLVIGVVLAIVALVLALVIGVAITSATGRDNVSFVNIEPQAEADLVIIFGAEETVFYDHAAMALQSVVTALQQSRDTKILIKTGYIEDQSQGNARSRATSVRQVLLNMGVPAQRIVLRRPQAIKQADTDTAAENRVELFVLQ